MDHQTLGVRLVPLGKTEDRVLGRRLPSRVMPARRHRVSEPVKMPVDRCPENRSEERVTCRHRRHAHRNLGGGVDRTRPALHRLPPLPPPAPKGNPDRRTDVADRRVPAFRVVPFPRSTASSPCATSRRSRRPTSPASASEPIGRRSTSPATGAPPARAMPSSASPSSWRPRSSTVACACGPMSRTGWRTRWSAHCWTRSKGRTIRRSTLPSPSNARRGSRSTSSTGGTCRISNPTARETRKIPCRTATSPTSPSN